MRQAAVKSLPITKAKTNLESVVKRVHLNKEYLILKKDGVPVACVMDIDEFEDYLELKDPKVRRHIQASYKEYLAGKSRPAEEFLDELRRRKKGKTSTKRR